MAALAGVNVSGVVLASISSLAPGQSAAALAAADAAVGAVSAADCAALAAKQAAIASNASTGYRRALTAASAACPVVANVAATVSLVTLNSQLAPSGGVSPGIMAARLSNPTASSYGLSTAVWSTINCATFASQPLLVAGITPVMPAGPSAQSVSQLGLGLGLGLGVGLPILAICAVVAFAYCRARGLCDCCCCCRRSVGGSRVERKLITYRERDGGALDIAVALPGIDASAVSFTLLPGGTRVAIRWGDSATGLVRTMELELLRPVEVVAGAAPGATTWTVRPAAVVIANLRKAAAASSGEPAAARWPRLLLDADADDALVEAGSAPFEKL